LAVAAPCIRRLPIIFAGPAWDYDIAFGNYPYNAMFIVPEGINKMNPGLDNHSDFNELLKTYYINEFRDYLYDNAYNIVDNAAQRIYIPINWDYIVNKQFNYTESSFWSDIDYIKDFINRRLKYMDDVWINDIDYCRINYVSDGGIIQCQYIKTDTVPEYYSPTFEDYLNGKYGSDSPDDNEEEKTFVGWYEEDLETPIDITQPIDDNIAVYALWK